MCNVSFEIPCQFACGAVSVTAAHFPWFWGIYRCFAEWGAVVFSFLAGCLPHGTVSGPCTQYSFLEADAWSPRYLVQGQGGRSYWAALFPECQLVLQLPKLHTLSLGHPLLLHLSLGTILSFIFSSCLISIYQIFRIVLIIYGPSCFPALFGIKDTPILFFNFFNFFKFILLEYSCSTVLC